MPSTAHRRVQVSMDGLHSHLELGRERRWGRTPGSGGDGHYWAVGPSTVWQRRWHALLATLFGQLFR